MKDEEKEYGKPTVFIIGNEISENSEELSLEDKLEIARIKQKFQGMGFHVSGITTLTQFKEVEKEMDRRLAEGFKQSLVGIDINEIKDFEFNPKQNIAYTNQKQSKFLSSSNKQFKRRRR